MFGDICYTVKNCYLCTVECAVASRCVRGLRATDLAGTNLTDPAAVTRVTDHGCKRAAADSQHGCGGQPIGRLRLAFLAGSLRRTRIE